MFHVLCAQISYDYKNKNKSKEWQINYLTRYQSHVIFKNIISEHQNCLWSHLSITGSHKMTEKRGMYVNVTINQYIPMTSYGTL